MKIVTVIGARPQFIKASVVSIALKKLGGLQEILLHTGQHFDSNMSEVFFNQLEIPRPDYQLNVNGGTHGDMTGRMLINIEEVLIREKPDRVVVYGDTNSTLAGALSATKLHIPVAHIEAGLRSFNMKMPEEVNRVLTDQISDILFCPTAISMANLKREGFFERPIEVFNVGDVMQDSAQFFAPRAVPPEGLPQMIGFILATLHRAENTDDPKRLSDIVRALNTLHQEVAPVVIPLHPRTRTVLTNMGLSLDAHVIPPVGYLEMIWLLQHSDLVLTDSGGVQKEAFFFGKACVTMRDQTEWTELVDSGANELVGADEGLIIEASKRHYGRQVTDEAELYGGGFASERIAAHLGASAKAAGV